MNTFKVTYEMHYPEADNDIRIAYVLASDFRDAQNKVERNNKKEYESAYILKIELLNSDIYV